MVKQEVGRYAQTFLTYPPRQKGASFNLEALKAERERKMEMMKGQSGQLRPAASTAPWATPSDAQAGNKRTQS